MKCMVELIVFELLSVKYMWFSDGGVSVVSCLVSLIVGCELKWK